ncbi:LysR substrate-binding domain-containing protein [Vibrio hippocampi]|uniref:HTH-type transcriptional regulator HdfR n=1 Tax=Vibrio hippocampi TaxID=654686 RepID=A0ABM8ZIU9_9VIBR|nr:LysR substrate-binding domain-containing protein [Vibrio hippocampi]CAH0526744.1 HTH-type transcriptional regulator HdfR [Vibrio hippocampi]
MNPHISLKQLRVFVAVTQHQTLTAASETLFTSKAAVSLSLSSLEKQLGHPLFDRVNNRLILNQEGQKLLPLADELLNRAKTIETLFNDEHSYRGQIRIGASDTIGNHIAPYLLSDFRQQFQHKAQQLFISNTALICQKIIDYELDIGIVEGKATNPELESFPFSSDQMCIVAAVDYPTTTSAKENLKQLTHSDWILRETGSGSREFFLSNIAPHIEDWQLSFELNTTEAIVNSVSAGLGFACLSQHAANAAIADGRIKSIALDLETERHFWLLVHKDKYRSPLLKSFLDFCQQWQAQ